MNSEHHPHTLHAVDNDLGRLNQLLLDMMQLVKNQLLAATRAVEEVDASLALTVIESDGQVLGFEHRVDNQVLTALARYSPVADDLRAVVVSLKIATELQNIDREVAGFARLAAKLFDSAASTPNAKILADMVRQGDLVKHMLSQIMAALQTQNGGILYPLLEMENECEEKLQAGIRHQLAFALRETHKMKCSLDLLLMMKALQHCSEHCKNLAEYLIFMLEGVDVRHRSQQSAA